MPTIEEIEEYNQRIKVAMAPFKDVEVPTILADGFVGAATANGVERITLYQHVFNPDIEAAMPAIKPVAVLAMPTEQLLLFAKTVIEIHNQMAKAAADDSAA